LWPVWRPSVKNITYFFGWKARQDDRCIDLPAPRATRSLDGLEVFTVNDEHEHLPEVAFLVKVDSLSIYHSGDYMGPIDAYKSDMQYLLDRAGRIDIAFMSQVRQAESLAPTVVFPIHAWNREYMYGAFARESAEKKLPSRVICPENKGDRFELFMQPSAKR